MARTFTPGRVFRLTTQHVGEVAVTLVKLTTNYKGTQLARVFCHTQNVFYPVNVADLRRFK